MFIDLRNGKPTLNIKKINNGPSATAGVVVTVINDVKQFLHSLRDHHSLLPYLLLIGDFFP